VQPISSRVLPWICAATLFFLARNLYSEYTRAPSTPTSTTAAMYMMILYREAIESAFGDPPDSGVMNPARALGARTREAAATNPRTVKSCGARRRRAAAKRRGRKARHSNRPGRGLVGVRTGIYWRVLARVEGHQSHGVGSRRDGCRRAGPSPAPEAAGPRRAG